MIKIVPFGEGSDSTEYLPYDDSLPKIFEEIKLLIKSEIPSTFIEHVGSSSIPGTGGRNVLDIAIPSEPKEHENITQKLIMLGFEKSPFPHYLPLLVASVLFEEKKYFVLLYIISPENDIYKNWISFRNYMRLHPESVEEYNKIKQKAVEEGFNRGDLYQDAKAPFLKEMNSKIHNSINE